MSAETYGIFCAEEACCDDYGESLRGELYRLLNDRATRQSEIQDLISREAFLQQKLSDVQAALDLKTKELLHLRETMTTQGEDVKVKLNPNKSPEQNLRDHLGKLDSVVDEYRVLATESSALREQIARNNQKRCALQGKFDELKKIADWLEFGRRTTREEEKALDRAISAHVKWFAENGGFAKEDNHKFAIQADVHQPSTERMSHAMELSCVSYDKSCHLTVLLLANIRAFQALAEKIEVVDDQGALKRKLLIKKDGLFKSFKDKFWRRLNSTGQRTKQRGKHT